MQDLFELLKREMAARGWNVSRLAEACGTDIALTSRWVAENPDRRVIPGPKSCAKIAAALGLEADYILELAGHREPQTERVPVDPDIAAIVAVWPSLDEGIQRAMRVLAGLHGVTAPGQRGVSAANGRLKRPSRGQNGQLPNWSHPGRTLALAAR